MQAGTIYVSELSCPKCGAALSPAATQAAVLCVPCTGCRATVVITERVAVSAAAGRSPSGTASAKPSTKLRLPLLLVFFLVAGGGAVFALREIRGHPAYATAVTAARSNPEVIERVGPDPQVDWRVEVENNATNLVYRLQLRGSGRTMGVLVQLSVAEGGWRVDGMGELIGDRLRPMVGAPE